AALRRGSSGTGPPSWWISSVSTAILRMVKSAICRLLNASVFFKSKRPRDPALADQKQRRGHDQATGDKLLGNPQARTQRVVGLRRRQGPDGYGDWPVAKVAVRRQLAGRPPLDRRMSRQI